MNDRLENAAAALDEYRLAHTPPALLAVPDEPVETWPEPREIKTELPPATAQASCAPPLRTC